MDFLLNPNISYLFIVGGFLLTILALTAPGTGVIEAGAILTLLVGGYGALSQPINWWALVLLVIGVIPFVFAVRKSGKLVYLIISIAALVVGSTYIFNPGVWWKPGVNPILALVVSILSGGFMWIVVRKTLAAIAIKPHNKLEELIGATGDAQTDINSIEGTVYVAGENWSARSQQLIPEHTRIRVVSREGFILGVEEVSPSTPASNAGK
jgi:membrane-bound ClpP family serine protease